MKHLVKSRVATRDKGCQAQQDLRLLRYGKVRYVEYLKVVPNPPHNPLTGLSPE